MLRFMAGRGRLFPIFELIKPVKDKAIITLITQTKIFMLFGGRTIAISGSKDPATKDTKDAKAALHGFTSLFGFSPCSSLA